MFCGLSPLSKIETKFNQNSTKVHKVNREGGMRLVPKTPISISVDRYKQSLSAEATDSYYQFATTEANTTV